MPQSLPSDRRRRARSFPVVLALVVVGALRAETQGWFGDTVDLSTASHSSAIGAAGLDAERTDPDFDVATPAIYYARVLEIPTPRRSTCLAVRNGPPLPDSAPATIRERAWAAPIFCKP